jgi:hypothetical protein
MNYLVLSELKNYKVYDMRVTQNLCEDCNKGNARTFIIFPVALRTTRAISKIVLYPELYPKHFTYA